MSFAENTVRNLKIASYNIRNGNGMDNKSDVGRTASVLISMNADVVALQEIDSMTNRSNSRYVLGELAEITNMYATYAPAIEYDGGKYGIGLLSKEKPLSVMRLPLPGREERRALIAAEFENYIILATHFSLTPADQSASIGIISNYAKGCSKPLFLAGDLNLQPNSDQYKELSKSFTILTDPRSATYPADNPKECIDYIALYKGADKFAKVETAQVVDAPTQSDHRPIMVSVRYGEILRTNPYLQNPTDGGITVLWQTNTPSHSWVEWGVDSTNFQRAHTLIAGQVISNNKLNKIRINGVELGKKYFYRIVSREITYYGAYGKNFGGEYRSPIYSFHLPNEGDKNFTALIFNDIHQQKETMDALMKVVGDTKYDLVFLNGDCVDDPSTESQAIGSISYFNDAVKATDKPVIYIRGNHEIRGAFSMDFTTLFDYVSGKSYGAMSWGDTRFVMLDCGEDKPDSSPVYYGLNDFEGFRAEQLEFLKKEHKSREFKKAGKRVLIHHIPLWGLDEEYNPCLKMWGDEIRDKPYAVSINAHTHKAILHKSDSEQGNRIPVAIGGGYKLDAATVMVLRKNGKESTLTCYNTKGDTLYSIAL